LLFAIAHIPNPVLTVATFIWGFCCCLLFLRYRNVYTIGIAHGILGICFAITVPDRFHHHMRVGLGYLHYHQRLSARPHS
jgi:membrane protease YdiL (CAAX protease family)